MKTTTLSTATGRKIIADRDTTYTVKARDLAAGDVIADGRHVDTVSAQGSSVAAAFHDGSVATYQAGKRVVLAPGYARRITST